MVFWFLFFLAILIYCLLIVLAAMGWLQIKPLEKSGPDDGLPSISMLIPFRDEEENLPGLIDCLKKIEYPDQMLEILFINDHSKDDSLSIIQAEISRLPNARVISCQNDSNGKKAALRLGADQASGELLLFTDADCVFHPRRVYDFGNYYRDNKAPDMIIGLVDYLHDNKLISLAMRIEFLSLVISGAGMAGRRTPVYCNGANLAIKSEAFHNELDLHDNIASGDDVFLLHALKKMDKRIKVLKSRISMVYTQAPNSIGDFLKQRSRWGKKAVNYDDRDSIILSLAVFSANSLLLIALVYGVYTHNLLMFVGGFAAKFLVDFLLLLVGVRFFRFATGLLLFPILEIIYPFYIILSVAMGAKKGPFFWKGRMVK